MDTNRKSNGPWRADALATTMASMMSREKWPAAICGHRHAPDDDPYGFGARAAGTYRLTAPFRTQTVWDSVGRPVRVTIEQGSLIRCDAWVGVSDPCSDVYWDGYRCQVLSGPQSGLCVLVADAGTPDVEGPGDWHGSRPTLGLPSEFTPELAGPSGPGLTNRP